MNCHIIFDVIMEDFCRNARLVAGANLIDPSSTTTYASLVSNEEVMIALTLAAMNDFPVKVVDIQKS